jgi:hypothetical protein
VGIAEIARFIKKIGPVPVGRRNRGSFIVFKIYKDNKQPGTENLSQMGHIVSFAIVGNEVAFIDPQAKTFVPIVDFSTFNIQSMPTYAGFNFIDIIFTWYPIPMLDPPYAECLINQRLPEITYGGGSKHTRKLQKRKW